MVNIWKNNNKYLEERRLCISIVGEVFNELEHSTITRYLFLWKGLIDLFELSVITISSSNEIILTLTLRVKFHHKINTWLLWFNFKKKEKYNIEKEIYLAELIGQIH